MNPAPKLLDDQWLTGRQTAAELGVEPKHVYCSHDDLRRACEYRIPGAGPEVLDARGRGINYLAHDVYRLARIMRCGLTLGSACKVLIGMDRGMIP